jgi:hypothetical protein
LDDGGKSLGRVQHAFARLPGNPLDLVIVDDAIIVALDNVAQVPRLDGSGGSADGAPSTVVNSPRCPFPPLRALRPRDSC